MVRFTPIIAENIKMFLAEKNLLNVFPNAFGTYVNVLFPENMNKNIQNFEAVFKKYHLKGKIFYAHKVNKSNCLVAQAEEQGICVDVASLNEFKRALGNGFTGDRIEITGTKATELISLGLKHNAIFNIDNLYELEEVIYIGSKIKTNNKIKILLRFGGFKSDYVRMVAKDSKFGISKEKFREALEILKKHQDKINLIGFSFHLDPT